MPPLAADWQNGFGLLVLSHQMQKIALLYDASQAVLSTFNLDEVLEQILWIVRDYFHVTNSAVLLLDPDTHEFFVRTSIGRQASQTKLRIAPGTGLIGTAAQEKRPVYAPDVSQDPRYFGHFGDIKSEVAIPLMVRDEVVGVLDIQSEKPDAFDSETLDLLTLFSTQASIALENARLYTLEQRRTRQLEAINAIARQTTAVLNLDELLGKVCDLVLRTFPVDHVVVQLLEEERLSVRAHKGKLTPILTRGAALPTGTGMGMRALELGKTVVENEVAFVPHYMASFVETRSEMCVPLIFFGEKLGVLTLESAKPHSCGDEVLRQVSGVFGQQLRKVDVVCRYGGEEFAILVPQTSGSNAMEVAEKLRRMVEAYRFPGVPVKVTISAGVAEFPAHGQTRDE